MSTIVGSRRPPAGTRRPAGGGGSVHARILARRRAVRAARRRREERRLVSLAVALVVLSALWALAASPLFAVRSLVVEPAATPNGGVDAAAFPSDEAERILRRARLYLPDAVNWFAAPTAAAEQAVERLPTVSDADVRRRFPPRLEVRVTPRTPAAVLRRSDGLWLVDAAGLVVAGGGSDGLPHVSTPAAGPLANGGQVGGQVTDPGVLAALQVQAGLDDDLAARVLRYEVPTPRDVWLELASADGPVRVRVGRADQLEHKSEALRLVLASGADRGGRHVDVRVPARPVLADS